MGVEEVCRTEGDSYLEQIHCFQSIIYFQPVIFFTAYLFTSHKMKASQGDHSHELTLKDFTSRQMDT